MSINIIDIGGCVGLYIEESLKKYKEKINHIYCFEPHHANYNFLKEKYKNINNVSIFNFAISNYVGNSKFYKKGNNINEYDKVGNPGSSLNLDKRNVNPRVFDVVKVNTLSFFLKENNLINTKFEEVKIDAEGSEYDILENIINDKLYLNFEKIFIEDHTRKIPNLYKKRKEFVKRIKSLKIQNKFFIARGVDWVRTNLKFLDIDTYIEIEKHNNVNINTKVYDLFIKLRNKIYY